MTKAKLVYIIAAAGLVFASAGAGSRQGSSSRFTIQTIYQPIGDAGDYRLSIYGGRELVCEEQALKLIEGAEPALDPIVVECRHGQASRTTSAPQDKGELARGILGASEKDRARGFVMDPQFAEGEWKMQVHIPPCEVRDGRPMVEVNFAPGSDHPDVATIECNEMPVGVK